MTKAVPSGDQVGTVFVPKPNSVIGGKPQYNNQASKPQGTGSKIKCNGNQQVGVCQLCGEPEHIRSKYPYDRQVLLELILYIPAGSFISKIVTLGTFGRYDHRSYPHLLVLS